jgi:phage tail sheath protein FI
MAETLLSPGVLARENDQSFIQGQPTEVGAAIIGPTAKGPVEIPTIVSSFSEFTAVFGEGIESGSNVYSTFTSITANNYFQNGGNSLLVTRVTSGTFTPATTTDIGSISSSIESPFVLETISEGDIMNSTGPHSTGGALASGSKDNIRWEIPTVNTSSGTFSLLVRRGDDTSNQKVVLESYNNLSLDPLASNYISKVIGDIDHTVVNDGTDYYIQESGSYANASKYIRIKSVDFKTPNYFDNDGIAKTEFSDLLPIAGTSGSFTNATGSNFADDRAANFYNAIDNTDTQGLTGSDYTDAIALMSNADEYKFNVIAVPGLINENAATGATQITSIVNNSISRGDSIAAVDLVNYNSTVLNVIGQAGGFDNSYSATYWPWLQTVDPNTGELVWVPASTMIPGVYAFTDASSDPWFAPAGITRGGLGQVVRAERKLTAGNRDDLYEANINPIATFPQAGVVVFGQKTLQKKASALDRVNVRRLLIALKGYISQVSDNLVFEQNTIATRNTFLSQVNPYLESVQQRQGLYAFKVVMDDTNNTADVVDRNELVGQIFLQPTRTAEYIILDFNVLPTGATFPA